ncbi:putative transposase YncI [Spirochaetia bacterium]|nr:putative transposase YncI [Spirochaetia bacterium]
MEVTQADIAKMTDFLGEIHDPRRHQGNFRHNLIDILVIGLCTVISGQDEFEVMEELGVARESWFKTFLELPNGIPDECTFERVFRRVNPKELMKGMYGWLNLVSQCGDRNINIDGKTIRGSADGENHAVHVVSAWVGAENLVLGQLATEKKSNEITAIPQLLDTIDIQGDTVTIDAMGCQREIARKIRQKGADYVLMVKENHPVLYQEIADCFTGLDVDPHKNEQCTEWKSGSEKDHGRIEQRKITITSANWYEDRDLWPGLETFIRYHCTRQTVDKTAESGWKTTEYDRYYLSSLTASAERFGYLVRQHWSIENQLHWSLDVSFAEDASQVRKDHAPENLDVLRKIALRLLRSTQTDKKRSARRKQFIAALNQDFLHDVLFGKS